MKIYTFDEDQNIFQKKINEPKKMCLKCSKGDSCKRKFWLESPECLISSFDITPNQNMTRAETMNTITRIVIIVFIILIIVKYKHALPFLIIALTVIIILYYSEKQDHRIKVESGNNPQEHEVEAKKMKLKKKTNPRRPYPALVPEDIEVKASRKMDDRISEQANRTWAHKERKHQQTFIGETEVESTSEVMNSKYDTNQPNYRTIVGEPSFVDPPKRDIQILVDSAYIGETEIRYETPMEYLSPSKYMQSKPAEPIQTRRKAFKSKFVPVNEQTHGYIQESSKQDAKVTGYELYIKRQLDLERQLRTRDRADRDSQINSIF